MSYNSISTLFGKYMVKTDIHIQKNQSQMTHLLDQKVSEFRNSSLFYNDLDKYTFPTEISLLVVTMDHILKKTKQLYMVSNIQMISRNSFYKC